MIKICYATICVIVLTIFFLGVAGECSLAYHTDPGTKCEYITNGIFGSPIMRVGADGYHKGCSEINNPAIVYPKVKEEDW